MEINCLIKNVYCLSSVKGYVPRSNMSYVYDPTQRMLYCLGMFVVCYCLLQLIPAIKPYPGNGYNIVML